MKQTYVNVEANPIEAVYMFPIEEDAAVISFEAEVNNRKITINPLFRLKLKKKNRQEMIMMMLSKIRKQPSYWKKHSLISSK